MSTTVTYKGNTIATITNQTRTLQTSGKWLEADVVITDSSSGGTPAISIVDTPDPNGGDVRTITALDISDTTAVASDVAQGKYFYTASGVKTAGTASGGGGGATQHVIHLEFTDGTDTDTNVYYDDANISSIITSSKPTNYGAKTIDSAALDGTTWYVRETWETVYDGVNDVNADTPYNFFWISSLSDFYPQLNEVYKVTIDGIEYRCPTHAEPMYGISVIMIGNPKYSGGQDDGSGAPFNLFNAGYGALMGDTELESGVSHTVKIERLVMD